MLRFVLLLFLSFVAHPGGSLAVSKQLTPQITVCMQQASATSLAMARIPMNYLVVDKARKKVYKPGSKFLRRTRKKMSPGELRGQLLHQEPIHSQRSWLYSTILPGLGQAYNQSYWKIPVIYGIFAGLAWGGIYNHQEYLQSRRDWIDLPQGVTNQNLEHYFNGRKRDRNLFMIIAVFCYLINILDAYVDGKLKTFDVSDNLDKIIPPTHSPKPRGYK